MTNKEAIRLASIIIKIAESGKSEDKFNADAGKFFMNPGDVIMLSNDGQGGKEGEGTMLMACRAYEAWYMTAAMEFLSDITDKAKLFFIREFARKMMYGKVNNN
jgi:hypothetical protein